jgi:DNA-binding NarL/FixJ family response regulator
MRPVRLVLSNDYAVVLAGLAAMLEEHGDRVEVAELTTAPHISKPADVILYDTFGRLGQGDDKLRRIVADSDAKVIVYSWDNYPLDAALAHGAAGYLHKGLTAEELVDAILAIHEDGDDGRGVHPPRDITPDQTMDSWPGQEFGLSARESEMLSFIARGLTNEEITRRAYLSINTVKTYIRTAYRKIGVTSRSQAVGWALRHGFGADVP